MEVLLNEVSFYDNEVYVDTLDYGTKRKSGQFYKHVDKVSLRLQPGSVTSIIGAPHETKYLLELIGLRQRNGYIVGNIYHDNSVRKNGSCYRDIAYVQDFDSNYFGHLTVEDFLSWAAQLRLTLSEVECNSRAREAAKLLGIESHVKVISLNKGQRILLSIAAELVENPTLICIESPIDFMEEAFVNGVVRAFNHISHRQNTSTTIVYTALAPSATSFQYVDHVALFFNRKLLYSSGEMFDYLNPHLDVKGVQQEAVSNSQSAERESLDSSKFKEVISECRDIISTISRDISRSGYGTSYFFSQFSGSDHRTSMGRYLDPEAETFVTKKRVKAIEHRILKHLARIVSLTEGFADNKEDNLMPASPVSSPGKYAHRPLQGGPTRQRRLHPSRIVRKSSPFLREMWILSTRSWYCVWNNKLMFWMSIIRFVISGVILGIMSFSAGDDAGEEIVEDDFYNEDSFSVTSTLFAVVIANILGLALSVPFMNSHFRMLKMEISSGIYNSFSAWCAVCIHDLPLQLMGSLFLALVVRQLLQLGDNTGAYYFGVVLCSLCGSSLAAAIAITSQNGYRSAQSYLSCASIICLFCGYLRPIPEMSPIFQWLTDFSFGRWAFELLMLSVFQDTTTGDYYLDEYGFKNQAMSSCVFWLLVWILSLQLVVIIWLLPFPYKSVFSRMEHLATKKPVETKALKRRELLDQSSIVADEGSYMDVTEHRQEHSDIPSKPPQVVSLPGTKKTSLSFHDVGFSINSDDTISNSYFLGSKSIRMEEEGDTVVLKGISGSVMPGELCCIVDGGDEGAGEVLLQVLSGRATVYGKVSGEIRISDKMLFQGDFVHNSALVIRGDSLSHSYLTVRETLEFSALLRRTDQRSCPLIIHAFLKWRQASVWRKMRVRERQSTAADDFIEFNDEEVIATTGQVQEKVDEVLRVFDLEDVADITIGRSAGSRGISPSQLRLLTIATEALNRPGLLYLQDPFHGLDWYHANRVCRVLKAVVAGGRAIICTLPHPFDDIFKLFDSMLLINRGMLLYNGKTSQATHHFKNIGFEQEEGQSDLKFIMDVCQEKAHMARLSARKSGGRATSLLTIEDLVNIRISMSHSVDHTSGITPTNSVDGLDSRMQNAHPESIYSPMLGPVIRRSDASVGPASRVMAKRRTLTAYRNRHMVFFYYTCSCLFGVMVGGMWFSLDDGDVNGRILLSAVTYMYMTSSLAGLLNGTHRRQDDYLRERASGAATGTAYWFADGTPVVLHFMPHVIIFVVPMYLLSGLRSGFSHMGLYCLLLWCAMYCNLGLMYLVTGITKNALMSRVLFLGVLVPLQLLFSGSIIYLSTMYDWLSCAAYVNPMQYFLAGVFINEFQDNSSARNENISYGDVKDQYGFHGTLAGAVVGLMCIGVLYRVLWLFSLKYREIYEKRHILKKAMFRARSKVSKFVSSGLRMSSTSRRSSRSSRASRASRSKRSSMSGGTNGGYFNAEELDVYDEGFEDEYHDDDSDQLSSKHSISEFVLNPDLDGDGISLDDFSGEGRGREGFDSVDGDPQQLLRREIPRSQATPPSRTSGHNRIIVVPKSGGKQSTSSTPTSTVRSPLSPPSSSY